MIDMLLVQILRSGLKVASQNKLQIKSISKEPQLITEALSFYGIKFFAQIYLAVDL